MATRKRPVTHDTEIRVRLPAELKERVLAKCNAGEYPLQLSSVVRRLLERWLRGHRHVAGNKGWRKAK